MSHEPVHQREGEDPTSSESASRTAGAVARVELKPEDSVYLKESKLLASPPPIALMARDLSAFFRISSAIAQLRRLDELKKSLLDLIGEVVPAESGMISLVGDDPADIDVACGWQRDPARTATVPVEDAIVQKALRRSEAILSREEIKDPAHSGRERSVLCLPLNLGERTIGVIYFDQGLSGTPLTEDDLQFLTAISGIVAVALENVRNIEWLESENHRLRARGELKHEMVGSGPGMQRVYHFISKVAPTQSTVLLNGESGTGKELVARAIHVNSRRANRPFLAINCATLTESLLESELFGHEKGAFTGAIRSKKGKFELADGGTLFLDEVGELAPSLQAKLLRFLQEGEFERVGGTEVKTVDIRLIAATNRSLEQAIRDARFREDLYYRLNVVSVRIPPLRERFEDVPGLAHHFALKCARRENKRVLGLSPEAEDVLMSCSWPGNVRELENAIERAVVMGSDEFIQPGDLPDSVLKTGILKSGYPSQFHEAVRTFKSDLILRALRRSGGNFTKAAGLLDLHPNYLHRLVNNLELRPRLDESLPEARRL